MSLIELVKMQTSQNDGCVFCLDSHNKNARKAGESEQLCVLSAVGANSPLYTPAEPAALAWTDELTLVSKTHAPDDAYEALRSHFSNKQIVNLTILIGQMSTQRPWDDDGA